MRDASGGKLLSFWRLAESSSASEPIFAYGDREVPESEVSACSAFALGGSPPNELADTRKSSAVYVSSFCLRNPLPKKDAHREALARGIERLSRWGIATGASLPGSVSSLAAHLGKGRDTDLAIIFLLGRSADPAALEALASLERTAADKEIKKEIRRAFFKLAQKGITPPRSEAAQTPAEKPPLKLEPDIEGYLSSVDGAGGRLVWLARPQAGSGVQLLQGMVSDREGLARVGGTLLRRKELRRMAQDIKERHGVTMISIPWQYGDQVLYEGFEKASSSGRNSGIEEFSSLRTIFNPGKPKSLPHPIYGRLSADDACSGAWRELSRRLLEEPEFRPWLLDEDWMKPYLQQAEEAEESRLVLNQVQKEERLAGIVRNAARDLFSGERGKLFQRRMEDMALYLLETRRRDQAKAALAVALAIGEGDPGGLGAREISFLTGLVQKSLAFYLGRAKEKAAEELSLIVKP